MSESCFWAQITRKNVFFKKILNNLTIGSINTKTGVYSQLTPKLVLIANKHQFGVNWILCGKTINTKTGVNCDKKVAKFY